MLFTCVGQKLVKLHIELLNAILTGGILNEYYIYGIRQRKIDQTIFGNILIF